MDIFARNTALERKYFHHIIKALIHTIDSSDSFTRGHSEKVMKHCSKIAKALKLDKEQMLKIKIAALMHDIGKFAVKRATLNKSGTLTEYEWQEIKNHPVMGAKIIKATGMFNEIVDIVKHHHERYSGGGYPNPEKSGKSIPLGSRMILVADAYDAMTSKRPYRKEVMTKKEAIAELKRCSGTQFDPKIVDIFTSLIPAAA